MHIALDPSHAGRLYVLGHRGLEAGDTLTVDDGSMAILTEHGRSLRLLPPGTYTVPAEFAGPEKELHFVDTRSRTGVRFGGRIGPIPVPEGSLSSVFGELCFRVDSAERLVMGMTGMGPGVESDEVVAWIKQKVLRLLEAALMSERTRDPAERVGAAVSRVFADAHELEAMGISLEELKKISTQ